MSMNPILNHAIFQLAEVGIRKPKVWKGGKHYRISWEHHGEYRTLTVPLSPGDYRSQKNNAAQLKRILRADGLLKKEPIKERGSVLDKPVTINNMNGIPLVPPELIKRIEALEKDMVAMLDLILEERNKQATPPVKVIRSQLWEQRQARRRMKRLA